MKLNKKFSLPVFLAAGLLVIAAVLYGRYVYSSAEQAGEWVRELYTVNRRLDLEEVYQTEMGQCYRNRFGSRMTGQAVEDLTGIGLPYVLLFQEQSSPVERSCVTRLELEPEDSSEKGKKRFLYRVWIDVTMERGLNALSPVEEQSYGGTVTLQRNGVFGWKLAGFSME